MNPRTLIALAALVCSIAIPGLASAQRMPGRWGNGGHGPVVVQPTVYAPRYNPPQGRVVYQQPVVYPQPVVYQRPAVYPHPGAWRQPVVYQRPAVYPQPAVYRHPHRRAWYR